jgi:UDP-N-acetylmuramate--alanine ligase
VIDIKNKKIHFVGIGGIGMSGLAHILLSRGYRVSGSDAKENEITTKLATEGAEIHIGHAAENVADADIVVVTAAVKGKNPELAEAKKKKLKVLRRSQLLGILMAEKKGIAVAGTHGKTTTSTMLSLVLEDAALDPTMIIGGEVKNIGGNAKDGAGEWVVAEACEYERSFLDLHPFAAIITNIEEDHLDCYDGLKDIMATFEKFITQIDKKGFLVLSADDANTLKAGRKYPGKIITYTVNGVKADFTAKNTRTENGETYFEVWQGQECLGNFTLRVPGIHNVANALAVIAVATEVGVYPDRIKETLRDFSGTKRRFEIKGEKDGVLVIDDYAHHPTEIQATLAGLANFYPGQKSWVVFQAHQYSRTHHLLSDFARSFRQAGQVIIPEIYEARDTEEDKKSVNCQILAEAINKVSGNAVCIPEFPKVLEYLKKNVKKGDIVITIGAGPVYQIGEEFLKEAVK